MSVTDGAFTPPAETINAGSSVRWTWNGSVGHSVSFANASVAGSAVQTFGTLIRQFPNAGTFDYVCSVHAGMTGTVTVQSVNVGPPSTPRLERTVILSGRAAWDLAVLPDGTMFFTERCRGLSVRHPNGDVTHLFGTSGAAMAAADIVCFGQSGVNGVALDPQFATTRAIYLNMASSLSASPRTNRVVRLVLSADYASVESRTDIITDIPLKDVANAIGGAGAHSGGRIRFGPDGHLYVTTGDNHSGALPQSPTELGGKVLRVTTTGAPAPGNSPPPGFDPRIYTFGHRNVQGITFRPGTGQPFVAEHGPNHTDEVTALVAGGNAGWDPRLRELNCPDGYCGYAGTPGSMPMTDVVRFPDAMRPAWTNNFLSQGMGPAEFLVGPDWIDWNGRLAVGLMAAGKLVVLTVDAANTVTGATNAALPDARYRSLVLAPDGSLYVATDGGEIWRIVPVAP